jgi:hypothetical protein
MSYAVAAEISEPAAPRGMYISIDQPTRSIRSTPSQEAERRFLVIGGEGHKPGLEEDTRRRYEALERFLADRFEAHPVAHHWSAHDYATRRRPLHRQTTARLLPGLLGDGFCEMGTDEGDTRGNADNRFDRRPGESVGEVL